ncbi:glycoside hydrolase family 43 protein [Tessaracoccus rhinocerotis]|uniref:Glycoside hydrolase family 43 protein n=1 Tax=Tessaracoccus rhinocerotis TaxID=1689449 RepID=A0A553JZ39_9ACTN|nr:glycoside hydrolase family 43 protein [Tessaracoccus rhinocerotis]TRY17704.1 glycoside hydrolase family 43 protein [Tessaracoccus rhinocerotis]
MTTLSAASTPVIAGFQPDPTIVRVGADYYLAASSFEYFPAVPIFHSTNLLEWTQVGNILTRPAQFDPTGVQPSAGIYAGTLRHHHGRFYYITSNVSDHDAGQFIVTAEHPEGPWSDPIHVPGAIGIDPDLCWDDEDRCLLTWHVLDFHVGGQAVRQAPIDVTTGELLATPVDVWQGSGLPAAEGPHLYRIGQWWYLLFAEGGTERGHCVTVARSRHPEGPYEGSPNNPIFTRRSTFEPVMNTGHADLVQTPDGGWAAVYLGVRTQGPTPGFHVLGRETFLAGIDWVDDWPVFVPDRFTLPALTSSFVDDFSTDALDHRWVSPGDDPSRFATVRPEGLRIRGTGSLCFRVRDLRWAAEAAPVGSGTFSLRLDPRHWYGLEVHDGEVQAVARIGDVRSVVGSMAADPDDMMLHIRAVDPAIPSVPFGHAGPDDITLAVTTGGQTTELARLDGRYLSTEVAAGFTGRMLCLGPLRGTGSFHSVAYTAN